jgi:hypothetical protein
MRQNQVMDYSHQTSRVWPKLCDVPGQDAADIVDLTCADALLENSKDRRRVT